MVAKKKKPAKVTRPAKKAARTKKVAPRAKKAARTKKPAARRATKAVDPNSPTRPAIMADLFATRREILATVDQEVCEIVDNAVVRERRVGIASRVLPELVARDFGPEEAADLALDYADALIVKALRPRRQQGEQVLIRPDRYAHFVEFPRERVLDAPEPNAEPDTPAQSAPADTTFVGEEDAPSLSAPVLAEPAILEPASVN